MFTEGGKHLTLREHGELQERIKRVSSYLSSKKQRPSATHFRKILYVCQRAAFKFISSSYLGEYAGVYSTKRKTLRHSNCIHTQGTCRVRVPAHTPLRYLRHTGRLATTLKLQLIIISWIVEKNLRKCIFVSYILQNMTTILELKGKTYVFKGTDHF